MTGEIDGMLAGAAAGLEHVAGFARKESLQHSTNRSVIAVKGRRVEPPVGFDRATILAEFSGMFSHARPRKLLKKGLFALTWRAALRKAVNEASIGVFGPRLTLSGNSVYALNNDILGYSSREPP
jgi:hypothetical protein